MWVPGTLPGKLQLYLPPRCCCWVEHHMVPQHPCPTCRAEYSAFLPRCPIPLVTVPPPHPVLLLEAVASNLISYRLELTGRPASLQVGDSSGVRHGELMAQ